MGPKKYVSLQPIHNIITPIFHLGGTMKKSFFLIGILSLFIHQAAFARDEEAYEAVKKQHRRESFEFRAKQGKEMTDYREKHNNWAAPGNEDFFNLKEKQIEEELVFQKKQNSEMCQKFGYQCPKNKPME
jgi:hypothetical protein